MQPDNNDSRQVNNVWGGGVRKRAFLICLHIRRYIPNHAGSKQNRRRCKAWSPSRSVFSWVVEKPGDSLRETAEAVLDGEQQRCSQSSVNTATISKDPWWETWPGGEQGENQRAVADTSEIQWYPNATKWQVQEEKSLYPRVHTISSRFHFASKELTDCCPHHPLLCWNPNLSGDGVKARFWGR